MMETVPASTHGQVLLLVVYVASTAAWILLELWPWWSGKQRAATGAGGGGAAVAAAAAGAGSVAPGLADVASAAAGPAAAAAAHDEDRLERGVVAESAAALPRSPMDAKSPTAASMPGATAGAGTEATSAAVGAPAPAAAAWVVTSGPFAGQDLGWWRTVLRSLTVFGGIVAVIYLVDGPNGAGHDIPQERVYDRDLFLFIVLVLILIGLLTGRDISGTARRGAGAAVGVTPSHIFNREQSEEWKGVMQTGFVLYHYFAAKETYNLIRLFIAAYVWMTGFGNFSFFWTRKDYSLVRVAKMLVRLNLLVAVVITALDKEYMLYYVCPLHSASFLLTYAVMAIGHERNNSRQWVQLKLAAAFVLLFVMFDVPGVFEVVWSPLSWLMAYEGSLHEWRFRSQLDHYVVWVGMVCAFAYPTAERWLMASEAHLDVRRQLAYKAALASVGLAGVLGWVYACFGMDKFTYNNLHPYVSWAPLLGYLILRNLTPYLRHRFSLVFQWSGRITLETYILQFHLWLVRDAKQRLVYIADYPLLNFLLATTVFLLLSNWLFEATVVLNDALIPPDITPSALARRLTVVAGGLATLYAIIAILRAF